LLRPPDFLTGQPWGKRLGSRLTVFTYLVTVWNCS